MSYNDFVIAICYWTVMVYGKTKIYFCMPILQQYLVVCQHWLFKFLHHILANMSLEMTYVCSTSTIWAIMETVYSK